MKNQQNKRLYKLLSTAQNLSNQLKIVTIASLMVACQRYELSNWPIIYPLEVEEGVNLFIDYAPEWVEVQPLTITLTSNIKSNGKLVVGLSSRRDKTIYLDTTSYLWKNARTKLILHELGHYVLNRKHTYDTATIHNYWVGFPVSIMHYKTSKPSDWNLKNEALLNYYLEELFTPFKPTDG